jgi:uncharacterized membrane protein YczE
MRELTKSLFRDLKQIAWALLLVYIVLLVMGYLFSKQIGFRDAFLACLSIGALVTVTFACIYLCNVLWVIFEKTREERKYQKRSGSR